MLLRVQVRERLIVAYYRYKNMGNENFMEVKNLCAATGFKAPAPNEKAREITRPKNYPESYFSRIPLPKKFVDSVLGRLRSDDVCVPPQPPLAPDHGP
jgi:WASH complex subunit strumpellin